MEGLIFYRCALCGDVVSPWDIKESGCCRKCGHRKIRPTNLSMREKVVQIWRHPKIWRWHAV
jgi:DNA-directed RNA polymerase subunit RPC12/RpoP